MTIGSPERSSRRWLPLLALLSACGPAAPECRPAALPDCTAYDAPTLEALHADLIGPTCANGITCHVAGDTISDLDLSSPAIAREELIGGGYVIPGDPACSEMSQRVASSDRFFRMPPSGNLPVEQQCAIIAWIRDGAP